MYPGGVSGQYSPMVPVISIDLYVERTLNGHWMCVSQLNFSCFSKWRVTKNTQSRILFPQGLPNLWWIVHSVYDIILQLVLTLVIHPFSFFLGSGLGLKSSSIKIKDVVPSTSFVIFKTRRKSYSITCTTRLKRTYNLWKDESVECRISW